MQVMPFGQSLRDRFWSKVSKDGPVPVHCPELGQCWIWTAGRNGSGRGNFWFMGRTVGAHQMSYELAVGEIPEGHCVLHRCDNGHEGCVRPSHLFTGTFKDNSQDMVSKGRHRNQRVKECPRGHEYDKKNTRLIKNAKTGNVYRVCRSCAREKHHERKIKC